MKIVKGGYMTWEEIIISALKNDEDLDSILEKATEVAPEEIALLLRDFKEKIPDIAAKLDTYPKTVSLLYLHFLAIAGEFLDEFSLDQQRNILKISTETSLKASSISKDLGEKALEAKYLGIAAASLYKLRRFSKAEKIYAKALKIYRALAKENPKTYIPDVARTLNNFGILYWNIQKFYQAEKAFKEALKEYKSLAEKNPKIYTPDLAMTLNNLGNIYDYTQKFYQAEKVYTEALETYRNLAKENPKTYTSHVATALNNLGNLYKNTQKFYQAEKVYTEALETYRNLAKENPEAYMLYTAIILRNLGNIYDYTQRLSDAEKAYTEALETYRILEKEHPEVHTPDIAMTLNDIGNFYSDTGKFSDAEKAYTEALNIYTNLAKEHPEVHAPDMAMTLNNIGNFYSDTGKFSDAEKAYTEALEMRKALAKDNPEAYTSDVAMTLNNLGALYWDKREFHESEKVFKKALETYRNLAKENPEAYMPYIAAILNNIGNIYWKTGKFHDAETAYKEALEIRRELAKENPEVYLPDIAGTLNNLGALYGSTQKFHEAEKVFYKALETYRELAERNPESYRWSVAEALNNLGTLYNDTGKFSEAEGVHKEALEIRRELAKENPEVYRSNIAGTLNNLGNVYRNALKFHDAETAYKEALEIRRELAKENPEVYLPDIAGTLNNFGALYRDRGDFHEAEKAYKEALEIRRELAKENPEAYTFHVAMTLNNLGNLYKNIQKSSEAEKMLNESLENYEKLEAWFYLAKALHNLYKVKSDKKILEKSRRILEMAILFSKEEKYKYAQKWENEGIYLSLLEQNTASFSILEALRDPELISLPWSQILSRRELEKAQKNVEFQKIVVEKVLKRTVPSIQIPANFPEDMLFVYIQEIKDNVFFFVVDRKNIKKFEGKREFFTTGIKLLFLLRFQLRAAGKPRLVTYVEKFEELAEEWYKILPQELRELTQGKDQIVFSPDYYCSFFPLEALQMNGQPLCMKKTVMRATSLRQFVKLSGKNPCFDSSLIVGNPWPECNEKELIYSLPSRPDYFRIPFLQGAEEEAKALTEKLPNSTFLLGQNATGEKLLSEVSQHPLIHFSGHGDLGRILFLSGPLKGFPPPFEPEEFSDLRKAQRHDKTRKINMMEEWHPVTDLDLFDVKLMDGAVIFLNACETGQHKYAGGGYYQGLPAVFLKNGAHSVVSSLVPIFDNHSREFATYFYETLLQTHSVATALKKAREQIRDTYKAQIYWVPYIHYGPPL